MPSSLKMQPRQLLKLERLLTVSTHCWLLDNLLCSLALFLRRSKGRRYAMPVHFRKEHPTPCILSTNQPNRQGTEGSGDVRGTRFVMPAMIIRAIDNNKITDAQSDPDELNDYKGQAIAIGALARLDLSRTHWLPVCKRSRSFSGSSYSGSRNFLNGTTHP